MKKLFTILLTGLALTTYAQNVDETAYQRYINVDLIGQMVPGYYLQGNKTVEAQIKYQHPYEVQNEAIPFVVNKGGGEEALPKTKISSSAGNPPVLPVRPQAI